MWTSNIHYYRDILEKLRESREIWQEKWIEHVRATNAATTRVPAPKALVAIGWYESLSECVEQYNWTAVVGNDSELKESVIDYFFSFCALWKVRTRAFIDAVGTCCLYDMIVPFHDAIKTRFAEIDEDKLKEAFEAFEKLQRQRESLINRLMTLEEAHRILLDGELPYVALSKKRKFAFK